MRHPEERQAITKDEITDLLQESLDYFESVEYNRKKTIQACDALKELIDAQDNLQTDQDRLADKIIDMLEAFEE